MARSGTSWTPDEHPAPGSTLGKTWKWSPEARARQAERGPRSMPPKTEEHRAKLREAMARRYPHGRTVRTGAGGHPVVVLTGREYHERMEAQGGVCAVCRQPESVKTRSGAIRRLAIDVERATLRVRGLLCHRCNVALGLAGDDPERLRSLAAYLDAGGF